MANRIMEPKPDMRQLLDELPVRRYMDMLRYKIQMLNQKLGVSAYFDQYPGKAVPYMFSRLYGPIGLTTPRRAGTTGILGRATIATPQTFLLPRGQNIRTGRDGVFYWCATNATNYLSWSNTAQPFGTGPVNALPAGDIFKPVIESNGGARVLQNLSEVALRSGGGAATGSLTEPVIYWEMDLYDRKRGRSITDGRVPAETFFGGTLGFRAWKKPVRWDVDTEIEPRLYVNQARVPTMDTDADAGGAGDARYLATQVTSGGVTQSTVAFYVAVTFKGFLALEEGVHA